MARFFFHLCNDRTVRDEDGAEFPHAEAARDAAIRSIRRCALELLAGGRPVSLVHRLEVEDEAGQTVLTIPFSEAVELE